VVPGVNVEASSPALIERVRTVITDGQGEYKIVDLRPGVYAVTFTLDGFAPVFPMMDISTFPFAVRRPMAAPSWMG
jgi:hypothetical protein